MLSDVRARMVYLLPLGLLIFGCGSASCGPQCEADVQAMARAAALEVQGLAGGRAYMLDRDMASVATYVSRHVEAGNVKGLAALINHPGPWQQTMWYRRVCLSFARAFCRDRPIAPSGADDALRALNAIAALQTGHYRDTVVYAARAIRFENPQVAKQLLLREYATGDVASSLLHPSPVRCGDVLREIGFFVPDEITSVYEVMDALERMNVPVSLDKFGKMDDETVSRMERAGARFNEIARSALDRADMDQLRWIVGTRDEKIAEIYAEAPLRRAE